MKNNVIIAICAVVLAGLGLALVLMTPGAGDLPAASHSYETAYSWYIMPQGEGIQPIAADDAPFKDNYRIAYLGDAAEKTVWLTFDLGYDNGNTGKILDALKAEQVPGIFFVCGHVIDACPELVTRMAEEGHAVCNHTDTHRDLSGASEETIAQELSALEQKYTALTGKSMPKLMRPPEGRYSESSLENLNRLGYTPVFWSFAYKDWLDDAQPDPEEALEKLRTRAHPGMVALLHSTSATNAEILPRAIRMLKEQGYRFGTAEELAQSCIKKETVIR